MKAPFSPRSNAISRLSLLALAVGGCGSLAVAMTWFHSDIPHEINVPIEQPVPFSHKHHVQGLGLDCRFCHTSVERSASAGLPDAKTCMNCHSHIWKDAGVLKPVRDSFATGTPLRWVRVHRLPDYVYFNHSIHIARGVDCIVCHGDVSQMAAIQQVRHFRMNDCMQCHANVTKYGGAEQPLTDCNHCHR